MGTRGEALQAEMMALLQREDAPLTAYDFLRALQATQPKIAPPTVYRALKALSDQHRIHRLESLNAYVACRDDHHHDHSAVLSICDDCGHVEEATAPDVVSELSSVLGKSGFQPKRHVIEVHGTCADCAPQEAER